MQISRQESGAFTFSEIESPLLEMLHAIPEATLPQGDRAAEQRLYPTPSGEPELNEEWSEFVKPGLEEWFKSTTDRVRDDLKTLPLASEEPVSLTIPPDHIEEWLNALNQARLALAARYAVTEQDMERPTEPDLASPREVALFQIHFYGFLQECFVKGLESEWEDDDED